VPSAIALSALRADQLASVIVKYFSRSAKESKNHARMESIAGRPRPDRQQAPAWRSSKTLQIWGSSTAESTQMVWAATATIPPSHRLIMAV